MIVKVFFDFLNWYGFVDEGVVFCKDGLFFCGWYLEGIDIEFLGEEVLEFEVDWFVNSIWEFSDEDGFWIDFVCCFLKVY